MAAGTMKVLWETPVPSTAFLQGIVQVVRPGRMLALTFAYEAENGTIISSELQFHGVAAFKCTFLPALEGNMINGSYDQLVDPGNTPYLLESIATARRRQMDDRLKHLRITFDDGPCFDVICKEHSIAVRTEPT